MNIPREIRLYLTLFIVLVVNIAVINILADDESALRWIAFISGVLAILSILGLILLSPTVQRALIISFRENEKTAGLLYHTTFYLSRFLPLVIMSFMLYFMLPRDVDYRLNTVEISGVIDAMTTSARSDTGKRDLYIRLEGNSNRYGIPGFRLPAGRMKGLLDLERGDSLYISIHEKDQYAINDRYIGIYALRTSLRSYLTFEEYRTTDATNKIIGMGLVLFFGLMAFYYVTNNGRFWKTFPKLVEEAEA